MTTEKRFWLKVNKTNSCWLWTGSKDKSGYGQLLHKGRLQGAHRISYELFVGTIPEKLLVLHKCDTPPCVNPDHLFTGTHQDNFNDMVAKGRRVVEERHKYCENGHHQSGENVRIKPNGKRVCRPCHRVHSLKNYHKSKVKS